MIEEQCVAARYVWIFHNTPASYVRTNVPLPSSTSNALQLDHMEAILENGGFTKWTRVMSTYCTIVFQDTGDSDSEEEQLQLAEVEEQLREHDEEYQRELREQEEAEISRDTPEWHQVHLAAEQIRAPEILFQVSIQTESHLGGGCEIVYYLLLSLRALRKLFMTRVGGPELWMPSLSRGYGCWKASNTPWGGVIREKLEKVAKS